MQFALAKTPASAFTSHVCSSRVARRQTLRLSAAGPGGAFDETPTEPITAEQKQISASLMQQMKAKICEALETDSVEVVDAYGNYQHVSIKVVSKLFEDKSAVQRQRLVYKAIWMELQDTVHAVDAMITKTPAEAAAEV